MSADWANSYDQQCKNEGLIIQKESESDSYQANRFEMNNFDNKKDFKSFSSFSDNSFKIGSGKLVEVSPPPQTSYGTTSNNWMGTDTTKNKISMTKNSNDGRGAPIGSPEFDNGEGNIISIGTHKSKLACERSSNAYANSVGGDGFNFKKVTSAGGSFGSTKEVSKSSSRFGTFLKNPSSNKTEVGGCFGFSKTKENEKEFDIDKKIEKLQMRPMQFSSQQNIDSTINMSPKINFTKKVEDFEKTSRFQSKLNHDRKNLEYEENVGLTEIAKTSSQYKFRTLEEMSFADIPNTTKTIGGKFVAKNNIFDNINSELNESLSLKSTYSKEEVMVKNEHHSDKILRNENNTSKIHLEDNSENVEAESKKLSAPNNIEKNSRLFPKISSNVVGGAFGSNNSNSNNLKSMKENPLKPINQSLSKQNSLFNENKTKINEGSIEISSIERRNVGYQFESKKEASGVRWNFKKDEEESNVNKCSTNFNKTQKSVFPQVNSPKSSDEMKSSFYVNEHTTSHAIQNFINLPSNKSLDSSQKLELRKEKDEENNGEARKSSNDSSNNVNKYIEFDRSKMKIDHRQPKKAEETRVKTAPFGNSTRNSQTGSKVGVNPGNLGFVPPRRPIDASQCNNSFSNGGYEKQHIETCVDETEVHEQAAAADIALLNKFICKKVKEMEGEYVDIQVQRNDPLSPLHFYRSFKEMHLNTKVLQALNDLGFEFPTKIQETALPLLLMEPPSNLIAQAQSGTGKTAAFVLTMLSRIDPEKEYPQCLCLAPTLELAKQIGEVVEKMGKYIENLKIHYAVKGTNLAARRDKMLTEQIVIGTPGITRDYLLKYKCIDPSKIKCLVLDEADIMIDQQGFADISTNIYGRIEAENPKVQSLLFSATYGAPVIQFATKLVKNAIVVMLKREEQALPNIKQFYVECSNRVAKYSAIINLYSGLTLSSSVIFCHTKSSVDWLFNNLVSRGHGVGVLHGGLTVVERADVINAFKQGKFRVLITTNVFARGIDVTQISIVINYDLPIRYDENNMPLKINGQTQPDCETYLHRIGRTGRFGKSGIAINFIDSADSMNMIKILEDHFQMKITKLDPANLSELDQIEEDR